MRAAARVTKNPGTKDSSGFPISQVKTLPYDLPATSDVSPVRFRLLLFGLPSLFTEDFPEGS